MATELDSKSEERKKKYIEEQRVLERWAKSGFTSGYSTIEDSPIENEVDDDNE